MTKTKWLIEPSTLTIYPKRVLRLVGLIFFVLIAVLLLYLNQLSGFYSSSMGLFYNGFLLLVPILLILVGESKIVFDGSSRKLYKKISFLTIGSIPFDDIAAVEPYQIIGSGFNYRLFKKSNRHGQGLIISSGYNKGTNANLIAFENEVLPKIDELVFANAPVIAKQKIYDFEFFIEEGGIYTVRDNKLGGLIVGLILIAVTIAILCTPSFMDSENSFKRILTTYFPLVIGLVFVFAYFSSIIFDKHAQKIIHSTFAGRIKKEYNFNDLIRFQIIRKTTNFIYSGTEVRAQLDLNKDNKVKELMLRNFRSTKKIERFLDEANTILGRL